MIDQGLSVRVSHAAAMWDMGTPEAKHIFEEYLYTKGPKS
jgi:hypothetical protein